MGDGEVSVFSTANKKINILTITKQHITMKLAVCFLAVVSMTLAVPTPQRVGGRVGTSNSKNNANTRFFTGNQAVDSAAFGAAAGVAGNYLFNAVTNPCRSGNRNNNKGTNNRIFGGNYLFNAVTNLCRSGNRNNNKGTNNRIFGGNTGNFLLGAVGGFAGAQLFNNAQGNPCNNLFSGR